MWKGNQGVTNCEKKRKNESQEQLGIIHFKRHKEFNLCVTNI